MNERAIFDAASEIPDPDRRRACLDQFCGGDVVLRARIEALLESHESPSQFLNIPAVEQFKSTASPTGQPTAIQPKPGDAGHVLRQDDDSDGELTVELDLCFLRPSSKPDSIGTLGHYEILQVLGQGAFGIVFRAFDEKLHRLVAIKVLNPSLAATSPPRKRFLREARSAAAIRHENIVQVHSVEEQPLPYLVMEYIDGQTLQQKLDGAGPLELPEILKIGRQLAAGLAAAHAKGLIHRDIKPGNILLEKGVEQRVKITDFGLARAADDASLTRTGLISGTPLYMSPEQANGAALDQRTDLFSLGSVLYVMASGRPPFRADKPIAVLKRVTEETPRPIQEIIPEVPDWLCAIITKLHSKKREDRFQSAQEVADLLARCQSGLQQHGRVESLDGVSPMVSKAPKAGKRKAGTPNAPASGTTLDKTRPPLDNGPFRGRRWATAAAAIMVLILGLVLTESTGLTNFQVRVFRLFSPAGTLVVEVEPVAKNNQSPQETDPDRRAAEYVLSIGGFVSVQGSDQELKTAAELPREPFKLTAIGLRHNQNVTDTGLAACSGCKHLDWLDMRRTPVTDAGLAHFAAAKNLVMIDLVETRIGDLGLASFKGISSVKHLWLGYTNVTDVGLAHFANCKNLHHLELTNTKITDAGLLHFEGNKSLVCLHIDQTPVTNAGLAYFQNNDSLTELSLGETQVTDKGLAHFQDCKNLKRLWLGGIKLTDTGLSYFKECQNLTEAYLDGTNVSDLGLAHLKNSKNLATLSLTKTSVSDTGLSRLADHKSLTDLHLKETKTTAAGIDGLKKALPKCKIEWDGGGTAQSDLIAPKISGFVPLFNGKDLTGWETKGNANAEWKVRDGVLLGSWRDSDVSMGSVIYTRRNDFQNFRFRVQTTLCENWSASMRFLWPNANTRGGFLRAVIGSTSGPDATDTAILRRSTKDPPLAIPTVPVQLRKNEWFIQEVVVQGRHVQIYVNNKLCTEYELPEQPSPGHLGIELSGGATIRIRKIEVQELPATAGWR
jgi:eukaryotic-like serine/threonine-protein kinase